MTNPLPYQHEVTPNSKPWVTYGIMATREIASVIVFGSYIFLVMQALVALFLCQIAILITIAAVCYRAVATGALYMRSFVNKSGNLSAPRTI